MDVAQHEETAWAEWPAPSPTSQYRINVRFYTSTANASSMRLDMGPEDECLLESVYVLLGLPHQLNGPLRPADFERYIRDIYQSRLDALLPYTLQLARYGVLTSDTRELRRALDIERRTLLRSLRPMPFVLLPKLAELATPPQEPNQRTNRRSRRMAGYLWTRLRLLFPLRLA